MRAAVTVILVARNGAHILDRTISAVEAQTRAPERIAMVNIDSRDGTREIMRRAEPDLLLSLPEDTGFGDAVREAALELDGLDGGEEGWLWLLGADNSPEHDALEQLMATVERNPSLQVTGPKQVRRDDPAVIVEYGQTMTNNGASVVLHQGELDQGQFERLSDVLAVGAGGMLVRRSVWRELGGFDPGLPVVDDALDFCQRVWLGGGRVLLTPTARVERDGNPETLLSPSGERMSASQRIFERRKAELHRRLSSSTAFGFILHWLGLVPMALLRSGWNLLRKLPGRIIPEFAAAFAVAFGRTGAWGARRRFSEHLSEPRTAIDRLRTTPAEQRKQRELRAEQLRARAQGTKQHVDFLATGGAWVVLLGLVASVAMHLPIMDAGALTGGALLPLSPDVVELWGNTGYGVRDEGLGAMGPADPFTLVLALLGTVTFWQPSLAVVGLWLLALPLAGLGAWMLAARLTARPWLRAVAGIAWMAAPPLLVALNEGRITAVIVHVVLPWLILAGMQAIETWRAVATLALLSAVVAAAAPSLIPALVLLWLLSMTMGRAHWRRQLIVPVPALVLFAPLVVSQFNRGGLAGLLRIFADPGLAVASKPVTGPAAFLGFPVVDFGGWVDTLASAGVAFEAPLVLAMLAVPVAIAAGLGVISAQFRTAAMGLVIALCGAATVVLAAKLELQSIGQAPVTLWLGSAQSLMLLGLGGMALAGLASLRRAGAGILGSLMLLSMIVTAMPPALAQTFSTSLVEAGSTNTVPAIVQAQGTVEHRVGTLILTPSDGGTLRMVLDRGTGETLDAQSTLRTTAERLSPEQERLASLVGELVSDYAEAPTSELHAFGVSYILLAPAEADASDLRMRLSTSLDANGALAPAGSSVYGTLWQVSNATLAPADPEMSAHLAAGNLGTWQGRLILAVQLFVLLVTLLLALPTGSLEADAALAERPVHRRWAWLDGELTAAHRPMDYGDVAGERVDAYEPDDQDREEGISL